MIVRLFKTLAYFGAFLVGITAVTAAYLGLAGFFSRVFDVSFDVGTEITTGVLMVFFTLAAAWVVSE